MFKQLTAKVGRQLFSWQDEFVCSPASCFSGVLVTCVCTKALVGDLGVPAIEVVALGDVEQSCRHVGDNDHSPALQ